MAWWYSHKLPLDIFYHHYDNAIGEEFDDIHAVRGADIIAHKHDIKMRIFVKLEIRILWNHAFIASIDEFVANALRQISVIFYD